MKRSLPKILFIVALVAFGYVITNISPKDVHPAGLLGFFLILYIMLVLAFAATLFFIMKLITPVAGETHILSDKKRYLLAMILACAPLFLVALQSIGSMNTQSIVLVVAFEAIACFYLWRQT